MIIKKTFPLIAAAFLLASCQKNPDAMVPAGNEVIVTATRVMIGDTLKEGRNVVRGQRRDTVKILKKSGTFQAEIPCEDVPGLLRMLQDPAEQRLRQERYIDGVRQDHLQIMQAPNSNKPKIEPVLKIMFSAADGPVDEAEAVQRAYRAVAEMRQIRANDEYRRAAELCSDMVILRR